MRRFHLFQLWFLIPGILLVATSVYVPLSYLYKHIFWTETEALITGREERGAGEVTVYYQMAFTDTNGKVHHVEVDSDTFNKERDSNSVPIYFNEANPAEFQVVHPLRYMAIVLLPFGLFFVSLGWPQKDK